MRLVFRPSKLHPSSSALTIRSRDHARCIEKTTGKIRPAEAKTDLSFQWRALTSPTAFIFRYGERMTRKTKVKKSARSNSSLHLIVPSGYVRVTSSRSGLLSKGEREKQCRDAESDLILSTWISLKTLFVIRTNQGLNISTLLSL